MTERGRRRIDRVTAPDLLDGVGGAPADVLRALRDECREEEARISYARRVVQGQLDIARSELRRRSSGEGGTDSLVQQLSSILADEPSPNARGARTISFYSPDDEAGQRRSDDALVALPSLSKLPDLDDATIADLITQLEAEESRLSLARRAVLDNLDGLQGELVRRYREGAADVDAILSAALPQRRDGGSGD
jgi:hypothetical protein